MTPPYRCGHAPGASNYHSSDVTFGSKPGQRMMVIAAQASEPPCASSAGKFMQACRRGTDFKRDLCADIHGFSPHAAARCGADDRQALKPLCHYITLRTAVDPLRTPGKPALARV